MTRSIAALISLAGLALCGAPAAAQDYIRVDGWYEVMYAKFEPSCARRALEIIHGHFVEVDQTVGRQVIPFDFKTGEWDHVVFFPIAFGDDGYDTVPPVAEWWAAFAEQEGSREQADALFGEFLGCIVASGSWLGWSSLRRPHDDGRPPARWHD